MAALHALHAGAAAGGVCSSARGGAAPARSSMRLVPATRQHRLARLLVGAAGGEGGGDKEDLASLKDKFLPDQKQPQGSSSGGQPEQQQAPQQGSSSEGQKPQQGGSRSKGQKGKAQPQLDTVNPYSLGRSARRAFDEVGGVMEVVVVVGRGVHVCALACHADG